MRERVFRHEKTLVRLWPAECHFRRHNLVSAEWLAVRGTGVLLLGAAVTDVCPRNDHRRAHVVCLRLGDHLVNRVQIVHVGDVEYLPAVPLESLRRIVGEGEIGASVDGDPVVVVEADQLSELEMAGERAGLVRDAFHEVAIATDEVRVVIDDGVPIAIERRLQMRLRHRETDGISYPLPKRTGRRLDAGRMAVFRMTRRATFPLPELLEILEREAVTAEVQTAVEQHRRMATRKHEAIAIGPLRIRRVMLQVTREQRVAQWRKGHGRARVARVRLLHRVHGKGADGVDAECIEGGGRHFGKIRALRVSRFAPSASDGLSITAPRIAAPHSVTSRQRAMRARTTS